MATTIPAFDPSQYDWTDPANPKPIVPVPQSFAEHVANPANLQALAGSLTPAPSVPPASTPGFYSSSASTAPQVLPPAAQGQPFNAPAQAAPVASPAASPASWFQPSAQTTADQAQLRNLQDSGAGLNQIQNKPLRVLARIGDIAGTILAPGVAAAIPGTTLHNRVLQNQQQARIGSDVANDQSRAAAIQAGLQAADTQAQTNQRNAQTAQYPLLTQVKINAALQQGAAHGLKPTLDENGNQTGWESDPNSPVTQKQQAQNDYFSARADYEGAAQDFKKAQTDAANADPNTPAGKTAILKLQQAQQRLGISQQNASTAAGKLGLSGQEFALNQEKFYNPQPTATERSKGDLAQSALDRVTEMQGVVKKHPEWFGPVAGRASNAQAAIGNQDPDMQTYLSAAQYLSDHSAGVFGGRGKYITEQLHNLTDPHSNPAAIGAALDEAQKAAQGFVTAGTVHGKGGALGAPAPGKVGNVQAFTDGGITYHIPSDKVAAFKKDHPNAR